MKNPIWTVFGKNGYFSLAPSLWAGAVVRYFSCFFFFLELLVVFLMVTISKFQIVFFSSEDNKTFISLLFLKSDNLKLAEIYLFRCSFVV